MSENTLPELLDRSTPGSIINLVPELLRKRIEAIPSEFFEYDEQELARFTKSGRFTEIDQKLRITFWSEYHRAMEAQSMIRVSSVTGGVCTDHTFYHRVAVDPARLVFILTQPSNYKVDLEETLYVLVRKLREIADLPVTDEEGQPNYKNIDLLLKTFPHIDNRVKGGVIQRSEIKSVTTNVTVPKQTVDISDIDRKLAELERKTVESEMLRVPSAPQEIQVGAIVIPVEGSSDAESV